MSVSPIPGRGAVFPGHFPIVTVALGKLTGDQESRRKGRLRLSWRSATCDTYAVAPAAFLAAARALGVEPDRAAVFEDALAGVVAGRAGRFALVVGVDRAGQADALREHGADVVVGDLAELLGRP